MELRFLRDTDRRDVDFVVIEDRRPCFAVECKSGDKAPGRTLGYFAEHTDIPWFYQIHLDERRFQKGNIVVIPFTDFCRELNLP